MIITAVMTTLIDMKAIESQVAELVINFITKNISPRHDFFSYFFSFFLFLYVYFEVKEKGSFFPQRVISPFILTWKNLENYNCIIVSAIRAWPGNYANLRRMHLDFPFPFSFFLLPFSFFILFRKCVHPSERCARFGVRRCILNVYGKVLLLNYDFTWPPDPESASFLARDGQAFNK